MEESKTGSVGAAPATSGGCEFSTNPAPCSPGLFSRSRLSAQHTGEAQLAGPPSIYGRSSVAFCAIGLPKNPYVCLLLPRRFSCGK
jgi:hypothetical protein